MNKNVSGFTLIELMIAVAIIGILSAVASVSYQDYTLSSNRTDGRAILLENAAILEKCKALYGVYNNNCSVGADSSITSKKGFYTLKVTTLTDLTYTLTATPVASESQAIDTDCTSLTLDHLGQQDGTGSDSSSCW